MTLSNEAKDFLISEIKDSFKKSVICRKYILLGVENNMDCLGYSCSDCSFRTDSLKTILSTLSFYSKEFDNRHGYIQDLCSKAAFGNNSSKFDNDIEKEYSIRKEIKRFLFDINGFGINFPREDTTKDFFNIIKESIEINK